MNQEYSSLRVASSPVSLIFVQHTQEQRSGRIGDEAKSKAEYRYTGGGGGGGVTPRPPRGVAEILRMRS